MSASLLLPLALVWNLLPFLDGEPAAITCEESKTKVRYLLSGWIMHEAQRQGGEGIPVRSSLLTRWVRLPAPPPDHSGLVVPSLWFGLSLNWGFP